MSSCLTYKDELGVIREHDSTLPLCRTEFGYMSGCGFFLWFRICNLFYCFIIIHDERLKFQTRFGSESPNSDTIILKL